MQSEETTPYLIKKLVLSEVTQTFHSVLGEQIKIKIQC